MTDARLRELERRRDVTGSVDDGAAYLRERVRRGDLDERRLRLAAHLGHEAAGALVPAREHDLALPWAEALFGFGRTLVPGSGLPGARPGAPVFAGPDWASLEELAEVRREQRGGERLVWIRHGQEAMIRAGLACFARLPALGDVPQPPVSADDVRVVEDAVVRDLVPARFREHALPLREWEFFGNYGGISFNAYPWLAYVRRALERLGEPEARRAIAAELLPWALGEGDPLRDRVEARAT